MRREGGKVARTVKFNFSTVLIYTRRFVHKISNDLYVMVSSPMPPAFFSVHSVDFRRYEQENFLGGEILLTIPRTRYVVMLPSSKSSEVKCTVTDNPSLSTLVTSAN